MTKRLKKVALLMFLITGCSGAIQDDQTQTKQQKLGAVTVCESNDGLSCVEIDPDEVTSWQEMVAEEDTPWRSVTAITSIDADENYEVIIDLEHLNAGVIPTEDGQGIYDSEEEYMALLSDLLGVPVNEDTDISLKVLGLSAKLDEGREFIVPESTGDFVFDALSTEDGRIIIAGVDRTDEFLPSPEEIQHPEFDSTTQGQLLTRGQALSTMYGGITTSGEVDAYARNRFPHRWTGGVIKNLTVNGSSCVWSGWRRVCAKGLLYLSINHVNLDGSHYAHTDEQSVTERSRMSKSKISFRTRKKNRRACADGRAFDVVGEDLGGTDHSETNGPCSVGFTSKYPYP